MWTGPKLNMDLELNVANIQPCCSKSINTESSNVNHKITNDLIVIDDDDSLDSAYETGSAVSRSTQSSPTRKHTYFFLYIYIFNSYMGHVFN